MTMRRLGAPHYLQFLLQWLKDEYKKLVLNFKVDSDSACDPPSKLTWIWIGLVGDASLLSLSPLDFLLHVTNITAHSFTQSLLWYLLLLRYWGALSALHAHCSCDLSSRGSALHNSNFFIFSFLVIMIILLEENWSSPLWNEYC